jgi:DNA-binding transcriptional ArsR family regulator
MPKQDLILAPTTIKVSIALEPVRNLLNSLFLLNVTTTRSGLGEWIYETAEALTADRRQKNRLAGAFYNLLEPTNSTTPLTFEHYLDDLEAQDPLQLRERYLNAIYQERPDAPIAEILLRDPQAYLAVMKAFFDEDKEEFKADLYLEVHRWLQDPTGLKAMLIEHLRWMWTHALQAEWQEVLPLLEESLKVFQQFDYNDLTVLEAVRAITGRDLSGYWSDSDKIGEVVFIPSAHIGPYISRYGRIPKIFVFFGARTPEGIQGISPNLTRSDLLVQLNALADSTRLSILELLTQHAELCAQDIINLLELSQSSASRHLRQLTASGYLIERRREVSKCYSLNYGRIEETILELRMFLSRKG